jgi:autotransporter-associated beta strand protein
MKTKTTKTDLHAAILAGSLLMSSVITSQAATYTWISNSDTDWNNTANWSGGLVPTSLSQAGTTSDSIVFNGTVTPTTNIPTYLSSFQDTIPMTFNSGGSFSLNFSTNFNSSMWANASRTQLTVGDGSTPFTLDINNMTYYNRNGVTSTYQVNDGSTLNINGNLTDYPDGDINKKGVFNLDGGTLNVTGNLNGRLGQTDNNLFINFQTNGGETTAAYGGAYANIAAVNTDLDTVFTSSNGLVTTDNGDSTFSVYGAGSDNKVTFSGDQTYTGATNTHSGTLVFGGDYKSSLVNIADGAEVELNGAHDYLTSGTSTTFEGAGTLSKTGAGTVQWKNGSATFAMDSGSLIDVQAGTMIGGSFANEVWTNNKSDLNVEAGATFNGFEADVRVDALTGGGAIESGFVTGGSVTFGVDNGSGTFTGTLGNNSVNTSWSGNYIKEGTGTQVLAGANTYTGTTTVNGGTLSLASGSSHSGGGAYTVGTDGTSATLKIADGVDISTHAMTISLGGVISPGNSPGTAIVGNQTWGDGGSYLWEINDMAGDQGADPGPSGWDWLDIQGTLDISATFTIQITSLDLANNSGLANGFDYTGLSYLDPYASFTIATATGAITGFDESAFNLDDSSFLNPKVGWSIENIGGDIILNAFFVPEPSSTALLGLGGLALALRRKRS